MIKQVFRKLIYGKKASSSSYENYLKKGGATIGKNFTLYCPNLCNIDDQNLYLLKIGDDFRATGPLTIMTHDYSWSVIHKCYGDIVGNQKPVTIHNNVFCGYGVTILNGVEIGDNVIIGAGSVVTKNCESNSVYAGVPAKRIMSLQDYYKKRLDLQLEELTIVAKEYYKKYSKFPPKEFFSEYFLLYTSINEIESFKERIDLDNAKDKTIEFLRQNQNRKLFNSYEEFVDYLKKNIELK